MLRMGRSSGVAVVLALFLLGGCDRKGVEYVTQQAEVGDVRDVLSAVGSVRPSTAIEVRPQVSGIVTAVLVSPNQAVREGEVIARIRPGSLTLDVDEANAAVDVARASLAEAHARGAQASRKYANQEFLAGKEFISRAALTDAKANLDATQAAERRAQAELARAQVNLRAATAAMDDVTLRAPATGFVLTRDIEVGQLAAPTSERPLFVIASDTRRMLVEAQVAEPDIGRIGRAARIAFSVEAYPLETFNGQLREILKSPKKDGAFVYYPVVIEVENDDGRLLPGMTAAVEFIHKDVSQVLRIPVSALYFAPTDYVPDLPDKVVRQLKQAGLTELTPEILQAGEAGYLFAIKKRRVFVLRHGKPEVRMIRIGAQSNEYVEVTEGLKAGDPVVTSAPPKRAPND